MTDTEKTSRLILNIGNAIKALGQIRKDLDVIRADNKDFVFIEATYLSAQMQETLKSFLKVKLHEEI